MMRVEDRRIICAHGDTQYRFPRMSAADDGRLLLFYRVGLTHMNDTGGIAMRSSIDRGASWSDAALVHVDPDGYSANNVVECLCRDGGLLLFISRYDFTNKVRRHMLVRRSDDGGVRWGEARVFDADPKRSSYYMTDVIRVSDGLLGCASTFALPGVQPCHNLLWHSADDGRTWQERSMLTRPEENLGDEVAMAELPDGTILLILRHRQREDTFACRSADGGRSWSERVSMGSMVGVLQRPLLRRLSSGLLFLSGRDFRTREVVAFLSEDDGVTFGSRCAVEAYRADGAYTGAAEVAPGTVLLVYYTDRVQAHQPDLAQAVLRVDSASGNPAIPRPPSTR